MAFRQQEIETENFTPRPYQLELLEKAKKENIIIPLATGSGKTFVAVMLIREYAAETRIPWEQGAKRSFFLVNQVALVQQQAEQIRTHTDLKVSEYHSGTNCDRWTSEQWEMELKENQVLVMTAQIFLNMITHRFVNMQRANVIVFDECHHATKRHPYREIMREYENCKDQKPRVLGLTASIINETVTPSKLKRLVYKLECALSSKIETTSDMTGPSKYSTKPTTFMLKCRDFDDIQTMFEPVRQVLLGALEFCDSTNFDQDLEIDPRKPVIQALKRTLAILDQLGPWCAWRVCSIIERQLVKLDKYSMTEIEQLFILMGQTTIRMAKQMLEPHVSDVDSLEKALRWLPHRVHRLLECFRALNPRKREKPQKRKESVGRKDGRQKVDNDFSAIVFVQQRYVAKTLRDCLKRIQSYAKDDYGYLKFDFVVGGAGFSVAEEEERSLRKRQEEVLKNFRQKKLNLLIATSVLEEGVDVRQCNCVIRFDVPENFRSFIQSQGRARKQNSRYIILVDEERFEEFVVKYNQYEDIEKILLSHCRSRQVPPKEDIDINHADQILPPYYPSSNGNESMEGRPRVTMTTAIPLINRYCAKLPSDIFTRLTPQYNVIEIMNDGSVFYQGSLILPINSPMKEEIFGPLTPKQKYAQMSTALEACKVLHQRQELDRHLLPVGKEAAAKLLIEDEDDEWSADGRVRPGSTKRKQYYAKKVADALSNARPTCESLNYIHVIQMELAHPDATQNTSKSGQLYDPSTCPRVLGILSKKRMPKIPSFPLFARQGELRARVVSLSYTVQLDANQLSLISRFHEYIFYGVLRLEKYSMKYDPISAKCSVFIAPLKKDDAGGFVLDFPFVQNIVDTVSTLPKIPTEDERELFQFEPERFVDAIVIPWYRNPDHPHFYMVTEICDQLSPSSPFPDMEYASFNDYFMQKYGLHIYNQNQPMLDVDYTSNRLNLTLPRYAGRRCHPVSVNVKPPKNDSSDAKASLAAALTQKQLLTPELIDIHPIPASMWNMIVCMPTVFYRINSLLLADEWRHRVEKDAFGRVLGDFTWEPLAYDSRHKPASSGSIEPNFMDHDASFHSVGKQTNSAINNTGTGPGTDEDTFEIGVWDPTLASNVMEPMGPGPTGSLRPPNGLIGLGQHGELDGEQRSDAVNANDDDWDDEDEIYFDVEISRRFMNLERRAAAGGINGEVKFEDPFAPNANIVPTGWDAATDCVAAGNYESEAGDGAPGLSFLSSNGQFDANALLKDIVKFGANSATAGTGTDGGGEENSRANSKGIVGQKQSGRSGAGPSGKENGKKLQRRIVDASDFDDVDKRRLEETLDFDDLGIVDEEPTVSSNRNAKICKVKVFETNSPLDGLARNCIDKFENETDTEEESKNLMLFEDTEDNLDIKLASTISDDIFNSPSIRIISEYVPFDFETDEFDTKPYGPNPCLILQALTMSNANDGMNLERLETVGDSFLKYAVTWCLFVACPDFHEGKLSFLRSKHVSNYNLYKLGKRKGLGEIMIASKFEPSDNWLPPCYCPLEKDAENLGVEEDDKRMEYVLEGPSDTPGGSNDEKTEVDLRQQKPTWPVPDEFVGVIPYNLLTQHSIPDKSIADAVEAMIGVYLLTYGPQKAIQFLKWLGLKPAPDDESWNREPRAPLLRYVKDPMAQLKVLWQRFNFSNFEQEIGYVFKDKAYLVQAFTHASYYYNRVTDCYQRLEFLGDAVLDYLITRHLFEDKRQHSPGILTDLRSALVNNTIFASLAVKYKFHKYFMALCPGMANLMTKFVRMIEERRQESNFDEELYLLNEEDCEDEEDIEVPKALGDMFESVAGAIYLDSGGSLNAVWRAYYRMMKDQIEKCCANPPKSPIRELLELEPEKAKFAKLERDVVECKVRVTVDVYGKGRFIGVGRNYRIAKCTAAKRALKYLKLLKARQTEETGERK